MKEYNPFSDGNGRTGRMLILDSCIKEDILPIVILKDKKDKYIDILRKEDYGDFTIWGIELQKIEEKIILKKIEENIRK